MAFITDFTLLNNTGNANWNTLNFDTPQLNDANNPTPFYLEGPACLYWWLKKGQTGNTNQSTSGITGGLGNRICIAWMNYPYAEIGAIPITTFRLRLGSTSFTADYVEVDALVQLEQPYNLPISGHTPIMLHPTDPVASNGTFSTTATTLYYGWSVVTGNDNDGKQGGFDWFLVIGWIGGHSATYTQTFFETMYNESYDSDGGGIPGTTSRPFGIMSKSGNNYTVNVSLQVGQAGATLTAVVETGKSVYFNNIAPEQNVGYVFVNGTGDLNITLTSIVHSWNEQDGTDPQIFTDPNNCDTFKITSCSFTNGGGVEVPAHTTNRWIKNSAFNNCGVIDLGDGTFEDNVVSGATLGAIYIGSSDTRRAKRTTYNDNTTAIEFDTVGNYTLDGDTFSGNTYDIENSDNASTITAGSFVVGRAYKILTVGTTDFTLIGSADNTIGTKFVATGVGTGTGTATEVLLINATNGANPSGAKVNNTGTNADTLIQNAVTIQIIVQDSSNAPIQNAQSSIQLLATPFTQLMNEDTDVLGVASEEYNYGGTEINIAWRVRKSETTDDPRYKARSGTGKITANGFSITVTLQENPVLN